MERVRITDKRVADALAARRLPATSPEQWLTDSVTTGFQIQFTKCGKALAYLQYWRGGKGGRSVKMPLGEIGRSEDGMLTVVAARKKASAARGVVDAGGDPAGDQKRERNRLKAETFEDAWKLFTIAWGDEDRYRRETKALVDKDAKPALGNLPLVAINGATYGQC
jgi:hypothetical protein